MRVSGRLLAGVMSVFIALVSVLATASPVYAAQITPRKLTLTGVGSVGGSAPGGVVNHAFAFTLPTGGTVGSIKFEYCTTPNPQAACTTPTGLVTNGGTAGMTGESGATGFGATPTKPSNGVSYLTRTPAAVTANQAVTYTLTNITNPTTTNETFYVRISTYASTDTTGSAIDIGTVAASTASQIQLSGYMPEKLTFCTGSAISGVDCSTATNATIFFDANFSDQATATATSHMVASTNAQSGYVITVSGTTMTSGSNTITAMGTAAASTLGTGQFGMNVALNTTPAGSSAALSPASNGTNLRGQGATGYGTANTFKFASGDTVADSGYTVLGPTNAQHYTVSYIVNVPGTQSPGTYTTTLTYVCTPTF